MARPRQFDEEKVLDAVMDSFWSRGYTDTSAEVLVAATGLGRGSLYAAYENKDGLFAQALIRYRRQTERNADLLRKDPSPVRAIEALLHSVLESAEAGDLRGCLATNSALEKAGRQPRISKIIQENFDILVAAIVDAIRRGQALGEFRDDGDIEAQALFILNALQGLRVLSSTASGDGDRRRLRRVAQLTMSALR